MGLVQNVPVSQRCSSFGRLLYKVEFCNMGSSRSSNAKILEVHRFKKTRAGTTWFSIHTAQASNLPLWSIRCEMYPLQFRKPLKPCLSVRLLCNQALLLYLFSD